MPREDPAITARFMVKFGSKLVGAFRECTVVSAETEPAEYKFVEDGNPGYYAVPGRMKFGRITLKRGLTSDFSAWKWRQEVEEGKIESARTNGTIMIMGQDGKKVIAEFTFENAWPLKVSGPAPNANSNDIATEEVEIICERITRSS